MKHHPYFRTLLSGQKSERLAYAARVINEGGLQSVPKLHFPGGALIGCSAGFVNIAKIKGTHNAMKSGMLAAEAAWEAVHSTDTSSAADMSAYDRTLHDSWVHSDLYEVRNLRPSFSTSLGTLGGVIYSGIDSLFFKGRVPWTFKHHALPKKQANTAVNSIYLSLVMYLLIHNVGRQLVSRFRLDRAGQRAHTHKLSSVRAPTLDGPAHQRISDWYESRRGPTHPSARC